MNQPRPRAQDEGFNDDELASLLGAAFNEASKGREASETSWRVLR